MADKVRDGRTPDYRGELHPRAKLSKADVIEIRAHIAKGEKKLHLAKAYGVKPGTIQSIAHWRNWKDVA